MTDLDSTYVGELALLYDAWKAGDNYEAWADLLLGVIHTHRPAARNLLDVGCGTGNSSFIFLDRGFKVTGCDISPQMLEVARSKNKGSRAISFHEEDMRDLPSNLGTYDVIHWMDDVANHLPGPKALRAAVRSSADLLSPDGILLFDVNTLQTFRSHFKEKKQYVVESEGVFFIWEGLTPTLVADGPARAKVTAFRESDKNLWQKTSGIVDESHFSDAAILHAIEAAGLDHVETYGLPASEAKLITPASDELLGKRIYVARRLK
ncbi:class I SAM-dependent methyltransferase [Streptomyces alfalfae]